MNTYLITSDSYKLIDAEVNKILQGSLNVIKFDLRIDNIIDVINEANYYSLTNEKKYIIVKCGDLFKSSKKEENNNEANKGSSNRVLEKYLENPSDINTVIFTAYEAPDKRKKIFKEIQSKGQVIILPSLNKKELTYKCIELLKNNGYKIAYDVASYIVENSYNNYDILTSELDKIYSLLKPQELTLKNIDKIVSKSYTASAFAYASAVINRNLEAAFNSSKNFEQLKIDANVVLITLAKEFEILFMLKSGIKPQDIQVHFRKEDWQMKSYLMNQDKYTLKELKKIIVCLNDYDYKLKSGLIDKDIILDLIAFELCD